MPPTPPQVAIRLRKAATDAGFDRELTPYGDWGKALAAYNCGWGGLRGTCGKHYAARVLRLARSL